MIGILYSCPQCGIKDRKVFIPERRPQEDVVHWMEQTVTVSLSNDHRRESPRCSPKELKDVKIPMTGAEYIGGPVKE